LASQVANAKLNSQRDKRGKGGERRKEKGEENTMLLSLLAAFAKKKQSRNAKICKRMMRANKRMCCILSCATPWNFAGK